MIDLTLPATPTTPQQTVNLSRFLGYPGHKDPSPEALAAIGLDESTNMVYFKQVLAELGPEMLQSSASVCTHQATRLHKELEITIDDPRQHLPTHMLAVWGNFQKPTERCKVTMHPVHNSVLSVYCANLPPLPTPDMPLDRSSGVKYTVPVVPLGVPSPTTFPRLCNYLYTKDYHSLFQSFFPTTPVPTPLKDMGEVERQALLITEFARRLSVTYTPQILLVRAMAVKGMWANTCALGISDHNLLTVLDLAWEIYINALAMSTKTSVKVEPPAAAQ
ncbi:hypothetical protein OF83DRAFT_1055170 [Amylostereum chailletii]|nr:hypothetical protein OF83DRAFT_1055170 [Amylostereum chailletii]